MSPQGFLHFYFRVVSKRINLSILALLPIVQEHDVFGGPQVDTGLAEIIGRDTRGSMQTDIQRSPQRNTVLGGRFDIVVTGGKGQQTSAAIGRFLYNFGKIILNYEI